MGSKPLISLVGWFDSGRHQVYCFGIRQFRCTPAGRLGPLLRSAVELPVFCRLKTSGSCHWRLPPAVLVGGTGTGKSHLAVAIARACIRAGARGRFHTAVDLINWLEAEVRRAAGPDRRSAHPARLPHSRRAWLSAVRPIRRTAPLPPGQPALGASDVGS